MKKQLKNYNISMKKMAAAILACILVVCPARAQWYSRAAQSLRNWKKNIRPGYAAELSSQVQQQMLAAQQMQKSVVQLISKPAPDQGPYHDKPVSAFVLEETYQGKKYLWGVTAAHYFLFRPTIEVNGLAQALPISVQAAGASRYTDIALFPLPQEAVPYVVPLHLAQAPLQKGEELTSYGFYGEGFQQQTNRRVRWITPARVVTSYEFGDQPRSGACGGPVLNAQNEVVGVHCGSTPYQKKSFMVPAQHIRDLWAAYHHEFEGRPLLFRGKEIYRLDVNEAVLGVSVFKQGKSVYSDFIYSMNAQIDLSHLEDIPYIFQADLLVLGIERVPFSRDGGRFHTDHFTVYYNIQTGETTVGPAD